MLSYLLLIRGRLGPQNGAWHLAMADEKKAAGINLEQAYLCYSCVREK